MPDKSLLLELMAKCQPNKVVLWEGPTAFNACIINEEYNYDGEGLISDSFGLPTYDGSGEAKVYRGKTPEEALQNLYLAINK